MKKIMTLVFSVILYLMAGLAQAAGVTPFEQYIKQVESAKYEKYKNLPGAKIKSDRHFKEMQKHILRHYEKSNVVNSFLGNGGNPVDCITIDSQPGLFNERRRNTDIAKPPESMKQSKVEEIQENLEFAKPIDPQLSEKKKDRFGNVMFCKAGTVPILRLQLEIMARYPTLSAFFAKRPSEEKPDSEPIPGDDDYTHYWAHGRQYVDNHGGDSRLNVWKPDAEPGWFSLAQHWYVGGSGNNKQTVEGGWQVAERKYDNTNPNLFIYSTRSNYSDNSGCYNLDCDNFIQTNSQWVIGGSLSPVSITNGTQYIFRMQWQLHEGNWWLFLKGRGSAGPGVDGYQAIGYYPEEHFDGGQLTRHAEKIDYGGEVSSLLGDDDTGEMGSGKKAHEGLEKSAYQRTIYYIDTSHTSRWANLTKVNNTSDCYTAKVHNETASNWATYLYFGGEQCPAP